MFIYWFFFRTVVLTLCYVKFRVYGKSVGHAKNTNVKAQKIRKNKNAQKDRNCVGKEDILKF